MYKTITVCCPSLSFTWAAGLSAGPSGVFPRLEVACHPYSCLDIPSPFPPSPPCKEDSVGISHSAQENSEPGVHAGRFWGRSIAVKNPRLPQIACDDVTQIMHRSQQFGRVHYYQYLHDNAYTGLSLTRPASEPACPWQAVCSWKLSNRDGRYGKTGTFAGPSTYRQEKSCPVPLKVCTWWPSRQVTANKDSTPSFGMAFRHRMYVCRL